MALPLAALLLMAAPAWAQETVAPGAEARKVLLARLDTIRDLLPDAPRKERKIKHELLRLSLREDEKRLRWLVKWKRLRCDPTPEVQRLERDVGEARQGTATYHRPGVHRLWYRSRLDGRPQPFVVAVPRGYRPARRYPLVVMLHGSGSSPMLATGRLLGVPDVELLKGRERCKRPRIPAGRAAAIIVAPRAFGNARYRGAGGEEVRDVLRLTMKLFRVDRGRITVTGLSMGGTGAMEVALQNPRTYAGAVALCGYFDRRLDRSTRGKQLQPWERRMMSIYSPVDWAENGLHLPLLLIHGKRDGLERAKAMKAAYERYGYAAPIEEHPVGHDVWTPGYRDGRVLELLVKHRKGGPPKVDTFTTWRARTNRSHWITVRRFADHDRRARVKAAVVSPELVRVETENVVGLRLDLPAVHLSRARPVKLRFKFNELTLPASRARGARTVELWRPGTTRAWQLGPRPAAAGLEKGPGLSGPMDDIYHEPIMVVYGTGGGQRKKLRAVAWRMRRLHRFATMRYPVVSDRWYLKTHKKGGRRWARFRKRAVILVGNEAENSVLARMGPKLPIRITAGEVRVGKQTHKGPDVGARFIYPNPLAPGRYVMVLGGTGEAYKLARKLPSYLPDYVVFDAQIARKPLSPVLGKHRRYLAAGTFDERWQLRQP